MTPYEIIDRVARETGVPREVILSKRKDQEAVQARRNAIAACRKELPAYTLARIGEVFGMHHTSVMYAVKKFKPAPVQFDPCL